MWLANSKIYRLPFVREEKYWNDSVAQMSTKSKWWPSHLYNVEYKNTKGYMDIPFSCNTWLWIKLSQNKWCKKKFRNRNFRILKAKKFSIIHKAIDASIKKFKTSKLFRVFFKENVFFGKEIAGCQYVTLFLEKECKSKIALSVQHELVTKVGKTVMKRNPFSSTILLGI